MGKYAPEQFKEWLTTMAQELGAHSVACLRMDNPLLCQRIQENGVRVRDWLEAGLHGEMDYLERMLPAKLDPWNQFPFAKSVIVLTFVNGWGDPSASHPFLAPEEDALKGYVSTYARSVDYHTRGHELLRALQQRLGDEVHGAAAVDTQAVFERVFATVSGLGVYGSNNLLRLPERQQVRTFIGSLFIDATLPEVVYEPKMPFSCESCLSCVKKCPTGALREGAPIDARKCISYLTIEKRKVLTPSEGKMIGDWLFGCDVCSMACPPAAPDTRIPVDLEWLLKVSSGELRRRLKGSAVAYAGVTQLRKNAVVVLKNDGSERALDLLEWVRQNSGSDRVLEQLDAW